MFTLAQFAQNLASLDDMRLIIAQDLGCCMETVSQLLSSTRSKVRAIPCAARRKPFIGVQQGLRISQYPPRPAEVPPSVMPRRRPDDIAEATDIRNVQTRSSNIVRSVGYSDTLAADGRTVLRQPIEIHTQPPPAARQRTDDGLGGDEPSFPDADTHNPNDIVVPPRKARRNNFFVSTVRLRSFISDEQSNAVLIIF